MAMTPEEFERLKEAEKAHLRKVRDLKQQYRSAKRKKGIMDALQGMVRPDLDDVHDEMLDKMTMENIKSEAKFEIAMENAEATEDSLEKAAQEEREREELRKAEAAELVRQMKLEAGESTSAKEHGSQESSTSEKTIGRATPAELDSDTNSEEEGVQEDTRGPKTIGRSGS